LAVGVRIGRRITSVAYAIAITVNIVRARITGIADAITIPVCLVRIRRQPAVVGSISHPIAVGIRSERIRNAAPRACRDA
jgi:hypothetical protein